MNLGQGIYEEAYKKNFINQYLKIVKKELGIDKIRELLIDLLIGSQEDTGVYDRASALDAIDAYAPELLSEKKDAMVLIKEMREQAYTDGFVIGAYDEMKEYDMSDDKIRASLIKMVQEQPKCDQRGVSKNRTKKRVPRIIPGTLLIHGFMITQ